MKRAAAEDGYIIITIEKSRKCCDLSLEAFNEPYSHVIDSTHCSTLTYTYTLRFGSERSNVVISGRDLRALQSSSCSWSSHFTQPKSWKRRINLKFGQFFLKVLDQEKSFKLMGSGVEKYVSICMWSKSVKKIVNYWHMGLNVYHIPIYKVENSILDYWCLVILGSRCVRDLSRRSSKLHLKYTYRWIENDEKNNFDSSFWKYVKK